MSVTDEAPLTPTDEIDGSAAEEEQSRKRKRLVAWLLVGLLVLFFIWWLLQHIAAVPNTIGLSERQARIVLKKSGFSTEATSVPTPARFAGRVVLQQPLEGAIRFTWWPVRVTLGASPRPSGTVAFIVGFTPGGLETTVTAEGPEVMPTDAEDEAAIFIPNVNDMVMPDVQNMSKSQARSKLSRFDLRVTWKRGPSTTDVGSGRVYYQNPAPGVLISRGEKVIVWLSQGPFNVLVGPWGGYPSNPPAPYPSPEVTSP